MSQLPPASVTPYTILSSTFLVLCAFPTPLVIERYYPAAVPAVCLWIEDAAGRTFMALMLLVAIGVLSVPVRDARQWLTPVCVRTGSVELEDSAVHSLAPNFAPRAHRPSLDLTIKLDSLFTSTAFTRDLIPKDLVSLDRPLGTNLGMLLADFSRGFQVVVAQVLVGVVAIWLKKRSVVKSWEGKEQPAEEKDMEVLEGKENFS